MKETNREKFIITRIPNSYYQKITTVSGFFTKKYSEWDDLYIKGFRYCASGWLHTPHKYYISLLNKKFAWNSSTYRDIINRYPQLWDLLQKLCLNKCKPFIAENDYSFTFVQRAFTGADYKGKGVAELSTRMLGHRSQTLYYIHDTYVISIKFTDNSTEKIELPATDGEKLIDLIALGLLAQLDINPNCIFYYIADEQDIVNYAVSKNWIYQ